MSASSDFFKSVAHGGGTLGLIEMVLAMTGKEHKEFMLKLPLKIMIAEAIGVFYEFLNEGKQPTADSLRDNFIGVLFIAGLFILCASKNYKNPTQNGAVKNDRADDKSYVAFISAFVITTILAFLSAITAPDPENITASSFTRN